MRHVGACMFRYEINRRLSSLRGSFGDERSLFLSVVAG